MVNPILAGFEPSFLSRAVEPGAKATSSLGGAGDFELVNECWPDYRKCVEQCGTPECVGSCFALRLPDGTCSTRAICLNKGVCAPGRR